MIEPLEKGDSVMIVHYGNLKRMYTEEGGLEFVDEMPYLVGLPATIADKTRTKPYMYALNGVPKYAWYDRDQLEKR